MKFKIPEYKDQFDKCHKRLITLVMWIDNYCKTHFNKEITITGLNRSRVDLRSSDFTEDQCLKIKYMVNSNWFYDPDRIEKKACLYHKVGENTFLLYLQVTDKTEMVPEI